jgi:membrane-associated HD superfamily phosphohydrolase
LTWSPFVLFSSSLLFFLLFQYYCQQDFSLEVRQKKGKKKVIATHLLSLSFCGLVIPVVPYSFPFSYDLLPFFVTFDFVFLLADASPFLLDFFLVAIIS